MEAKKKTSNKFSPEVRARAVRMVQSIGEITPRNGRRLHRLPPDRLHGENIAQLGSPGGTGCRRASGRDDG